MNFPMMALINDQGTAMSETGLCLPCFKDTENRIGNNDNREFARSLALGDQASEEFIDCGENEAVECVICGFNEEPTNGE